MWWLLSAFAGPLTIYGESAFRVPDDIADTVAASDGTAWVLSPRGRVRAYDSNGVVQAADHRCPTRAVGADSLYVGSRHIGVDCGRVFTVSPKDDAKALTSIDVYTTAAAVDSDGYLAIAGERIRDGRAEASSQLLVYKGDQVVFSRSGVYVEVQSSASGFTAKGARGTPDASLQRVGDRWTLSATPFVESTPRQAPPFNAAPWQHVQRVYDQIETTFVWVHAEDDSVYRVGKAAAKKTGTGRSLAWNPTGSLVSSPQSRPMRFGSNGDLWSIEDHHLTQKRDGATVGSWPLHHLPEVTGLQVQEQRVLLEHQNDDKATLLTTDDGSFTPISWDARPENPITLTGTGALSASSVPRTVFNHPVAGHDWVLYLDDDRAVVSHWSGRSIRIVTPTNETKLSIPAPLTGLWLGRSSVLLSFRDGRVGRLDL